MKRTMMILTLTLVTLSFLMTGCGGKYSDAVAMNDKYIAMMENYLADLEKADSAKDVANAMNDFTDGMEKLWPEMKKLSEKYPELKDRSNPPDELIESEKKAEEVGKKFAGSMMKMMQYMKDPEVRKAQERMGKVMLDMQ